MLENKNRNLSTPPSTSLIIPLVHNRISGRPAFLCRLHIPRPALLYSLQTGFPPPSLVFGVCVVLLTPGATSPFPECPPPSARDSTPPPPMVSSHSLAILSESPLHPFFSHCIKEKLRVMTLFLRVWSHIPPQPSRLFP